MYVHLVSMLRDRALLPVIIFSFSKKKCEAYADALTHLDLTTSGAQKSDIKVFCDRSLQRLKGTDRELPQVMRMKELLARGIAVHHSGLLPILKEV